MDSEKIYIDSDHNLSFSCVRDSLDGTFLNTGTCLWSLKDVDEVEIDSGVLPYVTDSDGLYRGVVDSSVTVLLIEGKTYFLDISFVQGAYEDARRKRLIATWRK